jgi:hypothetical protein
LRSEHPDGRRDPDVIVEPDPALEHRGEGRSLKAEVSARGQERARDRAGGGDEGKRQGDDRHAVEMRGGEPVHEQGGQQHVIAQALGLRPERLPGKARPAQAGTQRDQQSDGNEGEDDGGDHRGRTVRRPNFGPDI